jgi:hypothetical protein
MSDVIFIAATIVFFAICALYVHWCDKIIGPDDFHSTSDENNEALDEAGGPVLLAASSSASRDVTS